MKTHIERAIDVANHDPKDVSTSEYIAVLATLRELNTPQAVTAMKFVETQLRLRGRNGGCNGNSVG